MRSRRSSRPTFIKRGCETSFAAGCLIVTAAGSDKRYRHILSLMKRPTEGATHLVALPPGQPTPEQPGNDWVVELSRLRTEVRSAAPTSVSPDVRFSPFVDVSCLSRQQLGAIVAAVKDIAAERTVHLELAYSLGRFVPPLDSPPTKVWRIAPVNSSYSGWTDEPGKPVDVVVGLGYGEGKALGAVEYLDRPHIDILSARFVLQPNRFDVVVASNMFGDILSDLGPACTGTIGLAPSANLNPERNFPSLFEPVHGSAPDTYGQNTANPVAMIWSGALMLDFLGCRSAHDAIVSAIEAVLAQGPRRRDLGGTASTMEMGMAIAALVEKSNV